MDKIYFRLVYNRKKKLNKSGKALITGGSLQEA